MHTGDAGLSQSGSVILLKFDIVILIVLFAFQSIIDLLSFLVASRTDVNLCVKRYVTFLTTLRPLSPVCCKQVASTIYSKTTLMTPDPTKEDNVTLNITIADRTLPPSTSNDISDFDFSYKLVSSQPVSNIIVASLLGFGDAHIEGFVELDAFGVTRVSCEAYSYTYPTFPP